MGPEGATDAAPVVVGVFVVAVKIGVASGVALGFRFRVGEFGCGDGQRKQHYRKDGGFRQPRGLRHFWTPVQPRTKRGGSINVLSQSDQ